MIGLIPVVPTTAQRAKVDAKQLTELLKHPVGHRQEIGEVVDRLQADQKKDSGIKLDPAIQHLVDQQTAMDAMSAAVQGKKS